MSKDREKDLWSHDVKTNWHPPQGFFEQPAALIAESLKKDSQDLKQAMERLNFYINRAGDKLKPEAKARLEEAKKILDKLYR